MVHFDPGKKTEFLSEFVFRSEAQPRSEIRDEDKNSVFFPDETMLFDTNKNQHCENRVFSSLILLRCFDTTTKKALKVTKKMNWLIIDSTIIILEASIIFSQCLQTLVTSNEKALVFSCVSLLFSTSHVSPSWNLMFSKVICISSPLLNKP